MTAAPLLFAIGASRPLGERIAGRLGLPLSPHEERSFEDGEQKIRPLVDVAGRDVAVVHSLDGDGEQSANDKLCRLLFFVGALRDAAAASVTVVAPYLCYARKDRRTKPHDPVTSRYVAELVEAMGAARMVTVDVHNLAAFENAFRIPTVHLSAGALFAAHLAGIVGDGPVAAISPDPGGVKRAEAFRETLEGVLGRAVAGGFMEKFRSLGEVTGSAFAGGVAGRTVIILDDLISSGGTMARTAAACRARGAAHVYLAATHGLFNADADRTLSEAAVDGIVITDTVVPRRLSEGLTRKLTVLDVSGLIAGAILPREAREGDRAAAPKERRRGEGGE